MARPLIARSRPIPELVSVDGWREVALEPVDEPLVPVAEITRVREDPRYHRQGLAAALRECWVRAGVAERLERAAGSLPDGLTLVVWDGYRPLALQEALYSEYLTELSALHPEWPADALEDAAARYVMPPSRDPRTPPPHLTGGAVDLTLGDARGAPLELGTLFDAFVPEAAARALEDRPGPARDHRRVLFHAMSGAGFTAYEPEWWHFDHGDQLWGLVTGQPARYGPAPSPLRETLD